MQRLSKAEEREAKRNYADWMDLASIDGLQVLYRDDEETETSSYQVVDRQGRADGTGEWYPVVPEAR